MNDRIDTEKWWTDDRLERVEPIGTRTSIGFWDGVDEHGRDVGGYGPLEFEGDHPRLGSWRCCPREGRAQAALRHGAGAQALRGAPALGEALRRERTKAPVGLEDLEAMAPFAQSIVNAAPTATCCAVHGVGAALLAARVLLETSRKKLTPEELVIFEREFARVRQELEELKLEHHTVSASNTEAVH